MVATGGNANAEAAHRRLEQDVHEAATAVFRELFKVPVPKGWGKRWREFLDGQRALEVEARELVKGFAKNKQALPAQWRRVREYLLAHGIDPVVYDIDRDFGSRMALTVSGRWLLDHYVAAGIPVMKEIKAEHSRWGPFLGPIWSGLMLTHFEWIPAPDPSPLDRAAGDPAWNPGASTMDAVFLTDREVAALAILIFGTGTIDGGHVVVRRTDGRDRVSSAEVLKRMRQCISRARRDLKGQIPAEGYEGLRRLEARARLPAVPWPQPWTSQSLLDYFESV